MIDALHDTFKKLQHCKIEYGIFAKNGSKLLTVSITNPDSTITEHQIKASDALYLLDKGTVLQPAKKLLQQCKPIISKHFTVAMSKIISEAIALNKVPDVEPPFKDAAKKSEKEIRETIFHDDENKDIVQKLIGTTTSMISLNSLAQYIQVKYIIK